VFCISSAIYLFGALFYGIFASGDRQPWALDECAGKEDRPTKDDEKKVSGYDNHAVSDIPVD